MHLDVVAEFAVIGDPEAGIAKGEEIGDARDVTLGCGLGRAAELRQSGSNRAPILGGLAIAADKKSAGYLPERPAERLLFCPRRVHFNPWSRRFFRPCLRLLPGTDYRCQIRLRFEVDICKPREHQSRQIALT